MGKHLKLFQTQADFATFQDSSNWRLPNVSYIVESPKMKFKKKISDTTFGIDGQSYTIPGTMTWQELFESDVVVQHNAEYENELNHFVGYCDPEDSIDCCFEYLYLDGEFISYDVCTWWAHLGPCGCINRKTKNLYDDAGNKVLPTDTIKPISYQIQ